MSTSTISSATAAPTPVKFEGHDVVDGKVQPNKLTGGFPLYRSYLESADVVAPIQNKFNEFVAAETKKAKEAQEAKDAQAAKEAAEKKAAEDAANAESIFYTIAAAPFRAVSWVFGQISAFFSNIFSICFVKSEEKADDKKVEQKVEDKKVEQKA